MAPNIKRPYGASDRVVAPSSGGPGKTKQASKDECDINQIMKRYAKTGQLPPGMGTGRYGDFSTYEDFLSAQIVVKTAEIQFNSLPAQVRQRFNNDPANLLEFVGNPDNLEEARKLGLLKEEIKQEIKEPVVPAKVPVENPK